METTNDSNDFSRRKFIQGSAVIAGSFLIPLPSGNVKLTRTKEKLKFRKDGKLFIIESPAFEFCLNTDKNLRAVWWLNKFTGRKLNLGAGNEVEFTIGLPYSVAESADLIILKTPDQQSRTDDNLLFELYDKKIQARVFVSYGWDGIQPVLTKNVQIINEGPSVWNRLLDLHLGSYTTDRVPYSDPDWPVLLTKKAWINADLDFWDDPAGSVRGYPAFLENQFFAGLTHPSGFSLIDGKDLKMHQHPGKRIEPGQHFDSIQAVYGVSETGGINRKFKDLIYSRMRRVIRGHDHPYAIMDTCGAQNNTGEDYFKVSESWSLEHIEKLKQAQHDSGVHFDHYVIEFWHDSKGDLKQCDPIRFPNNFETIKPALNLLGTRLGLWISSGQYTNDKTMDTWTIGANPVLYDCSTDGNGKGRICRSTAPANQMYIDGLIYQIRKNNIRQIKFDVGGDIDCGCCFPWCNNPKHEHLSGDLYSVEANHNAQIALLTALDKESPDVFLTLYWGHYSPWWLLFGDTVYDTGSRMEMASLALKPALFGRSSNVRRLDQGKRMAAKYIPDLAWDSLGISLSDWDWNNRLGSNKWQEGVVMDMCRGSLLLHIWSDNDCIPVKDRPQMAEFINLLKARPECFRNPISIGNPFTDDFWGYCCTDGKKAMIALDNGSWTDQEIMLELNSTWGLPDNGDWDIYRWFPDPVKLETTDRTGFKNKTTIHIRPFTAVLLEAVPRGDKPAMDKQWTTIPVPGRYQHQSAPVVISTIFNKREKGKAISVKGKLPVINSKGWLAVSTEFKKDQYPFLSLHNKPESISGSINGETAQWQVALDNPWYPAPWPGTYRLEVEAHFSEKNFELNCATHVPPDADIVVKSYFIPAD